MQRKHQRKNPPAGGTRAGRRQRRGACIPHSRTFVSDLPLNLWSLLLKCVYQTPTSYCTFFCEWIALVLYRGFSKAYLEPTSFQEKDVRLCCAAVSRPTALTCRHVVSQSDAHPALSIPDTDTSFTGPGPRPHGAGALLPEHLALDSS